MSNLKHIGDDEEFNAHLKSVGDDLTVIDFFTTWCGPCKQMEPVLQSLSMKYPRVLFLKVDADKCFETAMKHDVKGVPLFIIYMNKGIVDQVVGAHPQELDRKLRQYEQMHRQANPSFSTVASESEMKSLSQVISSIGKVQDVSPFLEETECYCMNDLTPSAFDGFLGGKKLVSGKGSGKLLLVYSFKQKLMLHSFKIKAKVDTGPKVLRLFANHPKQIDFQLGTKVVPSQQIILLPEDLNGDKLIEFRTGNFTLVSNLQIFVTEPMTKGHRIEIESLTIFGAPVEMMKRPSKHNMNKITVAVAQSTSTNVEEKTLISVGTVPGTPVPSSNPSTPTNYKEYQQSSNSILGSSVGSHQHSNHMSDKPDHKTPESRWKNNLISQVDQYIDNAGIPAPPSKSQLSSINSNSNNSAAGTGHKSGKFFSPKTKTSSTVVARSKTSSTNNIVVSKKSSGNQSKKSKTKRSKDKDASLAPLTDADKADLLILSKYKSSQPPQQSPSASIAATTSAATPEPEPRKGILRQTKADPHANYHRVIEDALANTTTTSTKPPSLSTEPSESSSNANANNDPPKTKRTKKRSSTNNTPNNSSSRKKSGSSSKSRVAGGSTFSGLPSSSSGPSKSKKKRTQINDAPR